MKYAFGKSKQQSWIAVTLAALFFVGLASVTVALYQARKHGNVAPTAPESQPSAAEISSETCTLSFEIFENTPTPTPTPLMAPITVCKAIVQNNVPLDSWTSVPYAEFSVEFGKDPPIDNTQNPSIPTAYGTPFETVHFNTNESPIYHPELGIAAVCKTLENAVPYADGTVVHATYKDEVILSAAAWKSPRCVDGAGNGPVNVAGVGAYDDALFDGIPGNEANRNKNCDGDLTLGVNSPSRIVLWLNEINTDAGVTPTNIPTATPTLTSSPTATFTATNTPTDTPSNTPTHTPSNTPTNTPTDTPSTTPSDTPSHTPTASATETSTPTATTTSTATNTPTVTPPGLPKAGSVGPTVIILGVGASAVLLGILGILFLL